MEGYRPLTCLCLCSSTETYFSSSLLSVSKSLQSVHVLPCTTGSVGKVRVLTHWDVFPPAKVCCLIVPHLCVHTFFVSQNKLMLLFAWALFCFVFSFIVTLCGRFTLMEGLSWRCNCRAKVCNNASTKMYLDALVGRATKQVTELRYSFARLACGLWIRSWVTCTYLPFLHMWWLPNGWGCLPLSHLRWKVSLVPLEAQRNGWLSPSPATGLGWFGSNLLPPPADQAKDFSGPRRACAWGCPSEPLSLSPLSSDPSKRAMGM